MNLGTARKWIECLNSGKYTLGRGQLRADDKYCAFGVLADFLDPNGWQPAYIGFSFHGEQFKLPQLFRSRCRMKTVFGEFLSHNGDRNRLTDIVDSCSNWVYPIRIIEQYYEQF